MQSPAPAETPEQPPQNGIDIRQALEILSARSSGVGQHDRSGSCGCCDRKELRSMGQVIDLCAPAATQTDQAATEQAKTQRRREMQAELKGMFVPELLETLLRVQQERVATYRDYDAALDVVLQSGNVSKYPETVTRVTAVFAVLSDTIRHIQSIVASSRKDLSDTIRRLQRHEKEKLQLTAAYHLERIRGSQHASDDAVAGLYQSSMRSLKQQLSSCVDNINEALEELRCAMMDEADDDEDVE